MELKEFAALYKRLKSVEGRVETVEVDDNGLLESITLNGFAKSGTLKVTRTDRGIMTFGRYDESNHFRAEGDTAVDDAFDSIVDQAHLWYNRGLDRGFSEPAQVWLQEFLARGFVEEVKSVSYKPKGR